MRGKDRSRRKGTSKKAETAKRQALSSNSSDKETSGNGIVDFEAILRASEQEELPRDTADSNQAASFGHSLQLGQPQLATQQPNIVDDSGASLVNFSSTSGIQAHLPLSHTTQTTLHAPATSSQSLPHLLQYINHPLSVQGQGINTLRCINDSIFLHVPKSLQQQICTGEYINLALLLKGGMELEDFCNAAKF